MKRFKPLLLAVALATTAQATLATDWQHSPYGKQDEIGAANLLTPDVVKQAVGLVKTGKTYPLAVPVSKDLPAFRHRSFHLYNIQPGEQAGQTLGRNKFSFNDELVNGWTGVGTQLNGIGHIGIDNVYYNGNKAADFVTVEGVTKLGVEKVPPMVTRGVVLDMTAYFGKAIVPGGTAFTVADIKAVLKKEGITLRKGDVVLFNTGWLELVGKDNQQFLSSAWWQLTGLAQLAEFHSGLSQPARDQLRAIDREAAQAVSSNRESSGTAQFADSIAATLADPTTSNWLKQSLTEALARDTVDAANDAQVLFELLAHRSEEELRAAAHAVAGRPETTMAVRFADGRAGTLDVTKAHHTIITGDN